MTPKTTPKDFFLHLGAIIVLYVSVISLINLLFNIINYKFPDALAYNYSVHSLAWPISVLVVLTPTLFILSWLIRKDFAASPEKANLWIRRWGIFLTLFLTGATIIGDLVTLINTYLNGEISIRFFYKFLAILIVFGIVFAYFLLEKTGAKNKRTSQIVIMWIGGVIVLLSIIGGFLVVGSPAKQRAYKFDTQRVNDLQTIQYRVLNYWQQKEKLPIVLSDLEDSLSYNTIPTDPDTRKAYEYTVKSPTSFELCANFALPTRDDTGRGRYDRSISYPMYPGGMSENWKHEGGRTCFVRTIDPELYPVYPKGNPRPL